MPVDKFGRRFSRVQVHHHTFTSSLKKNEDFMLEMGSDDNRSMGCIDLPPSKSFTVNLGAASNKIVHTKGQGIELYVPQGLGLVDADKEPIFKFNKDGQNDMYKDLNCRRKRITNLRNPIGSGDAVNIHYLVQYFRQYSSLRLIQGTIADEPFTNIVLLR